MVEDIIILSCFYVVPFEFFFFILKSKSEKHIRVSLRSVWFDEI